MLIMVYRGKLCIILDHKTVQVSSFYHDQYSIILCVYPQGICYFCIQFPHWRNVKLQLFPFPQRSSLEQFTFTYKWKEKMSKLIIYTQAYTRRWIKKHKGKPAKNPTVETTKWKLYLWSQLTWNNLLLIISFEVAAPLAKVFDALMQQNFSKLLLLSPLIPRLSFLWFQRSNVDSRRIIRFNFSARFGLPRIGMRDAIERLTQKRQFSHDNRNKSIK